VQSYWTSPDEVEGAAKTKFAVAEHALDLGAICHIDGEDQHRGMALKGNAAAENFDLDEGAVLFPVYPNARRVDEGHWAGEFAGNEFAQCGDMLGGAHVHNGHAKKFLAGVAVKGNSRVIDGQKTPGLLVVNPHGMGVSFKQDAVLFEGSGGSIVLGQTVFQLEPADFMLLSSGLFEHEFPKWGRKK
jgi:hypothetical protein